MALAATKFWKKRDYRSKSSRGNSRGFPKDSKGNEKKPRTCFNCGNSSHFVIDRPYERREDYGGQLIRKKAKFSPKPKNFMKKSPQKALVSSHEEYISGEEEEEES